MILSDIGDYLSSGGIGTVGSTSNWGIYLGKQPDAPDRCVTVYEYGGAASLHAMSSGPGRAVAERPRVQVVVRTNSYSTGRTKANDVFRLLDGLRERAINGVTYKWAAAIQPPFALGRDENDRQLIACNFEIIKAISTA